MIENDGNVLDLDRLYTEPEAAKALRLRLYALQRLRLENKIGYIRLSPRKVAYRGAHLASFLEASEIQQCPKKSPKSENTGSANGLTGQAGIEPGSTTKLDRQSVHLSAQATFGKPRSASRNG